MRGIEPIIITDPCFKSVVVVHSTPSQFLLTCELLYTKAVVLFLEF